MIELALAFQDKDGHYAEHAAVVLASVFHNTSSPINVHILHDETLNEDNKQKLVELTSRYSQTINFYPITIPDDMLQVMESVSSINVWTPACMYRLLIPALIPVDKIIYLDCDVLVNMDIVELWQIELDNYYLGAIWDQGIMGVAQIISSKGLNPDLYFNSGVILFSLNNIRRNLGWYEETLHFLRNFPDTTMPDQDTLNAVFGGNYLPLDLRFNLFNTATPDHDFTNKIVHFAGAEKFWDQDSPGAELYQKYLSLTPWGENDPETPVEATPFVAKKSAKHKNNRPSYSGLKRKQRKVTQEKMRFKESSKLRMKDKRTNIVWISISSLKFIRQTEQIRSTKTLVIRKKRLNSIPYLPVNKGI
ncbi:glycosyltransferase family 8 protein [Paenibacillus sp. BR2-3]|uniref:glycosyltransferase family 8 protein n=1 Tax=Paenibacillus sp. BR2-3 TaxID=3048494 RepID=UPI0039774145